MTKSPLAKGWIWSATYVAMTYVFAELHHWYDPNISTNAIREVVGIIDWLARKGVDGCTLERQSIYALLCSPLALFGWHNFAIDARPRRPPPKAWHSIIPVIYLIPIITIFHLRTNDIGEPPTFKYRTLDLVTATDFGTTLLLTSVAWLVIGLTYFSILPAIEILALNTRHKDK